MTHSDVNHISGSINALLDTGILSEIGHGYHLRPSVAYHGRSPIVKSRVFR